MERNYLTADEIGVVVNAMLEKDNEYERQMVKYGAVAQLLKVVEVSDDMNCNDIYTKLVEGGYDLDDCIVNLKIIDKIVDKEFGVAKTVENILNNVVTNIDESMNNMDIKSILVELQKLQNGELNNLAQA